MPFQSCALSCNREAQYILKISRRNGAYTLVLNLQTTLFQVKRKERKGL